MIKYKKYIVEFLVVFAMMTAALHFFNKQNLTDSLLISFGASILTIANKYYLDKKAQKKKNNSKA